MSRGKAVDKKTVDDRTIETILRPSSFDEYVGQDRVKKNLHTILTAANRNDVTQLIPLVDAIPPIRGKPGRPLVKPQEVMGDRGYEGDPKRRILSDRGIATAIARRRTEHGSGLGVYRYVVEQTLALLHQFRRLRVRYDRRDDIHEAFMTLGCAVICGRRLQTRLF